MSKNVELVQGYLKALAQGDFKTVSDLLSEDLVWHQPGNGAISGTFKGKDAVFQHLGNFAKLSGGTFTIDEVDYVTGNNDLVAVVVHFKASSEKSFISMKGVDLFRVEAEKIREIWLFSEDIAAEDKFWTALAN